MFHEIFFAGGHIHWNLIGGEPVTAELLAELHSQGVAENVLAPYLQQLLSIARTAFSPEAVEQTIAAVMEQSGNTLSTFAAQLEAVVQAEQAAAYYGVTLFLPYRYPGSGGHPVSGREAGHLPLPDLHGRGRHDGLRPPDRQPQEPAAGRCRPAGHFHDLRGLPSCWASPPRRPAPSASSAARTAPPPSSSPPSWPRTCWAPSPWRPTPIWRWFP